MKILFMGTPDFARDCLKAMVEGGLDVVAVVTQPDRPVGRGYKLTPPAVKVYAQEKEIPVYQPDVLRDEAFLPTLKEINPDVIVVASYGKILPKYIIDYPKLGCINAHASILPRHRGAAPIQRAIMQGDKETGITIMYMDVGLDTGDMLYKVTTPILDEDNFETLHDKLAALGGKALVDALPLLEKGELEREKQDDSLSTYAAKITSADTPIDFSKSAAEILCFIRALSPIPLAICKTPDGKRLKIISAEKSDKKGKNPGEVIDLDNTGFTVSVGNGEAVHISGVQPESKGRMSAGDFVRGRKINVGDVLYND